MHPTRRRVLLTGSAGIVGLSLADWLAVARGLEIERVLDDVVNGALEAAKIAGASYADVRIVRRRQEGVSAREDHIQGAWATESYGVGVRVLVDGAWGFAASSRVEPEEAKLVATVAVGIARANAKIVKKHVELAPTPAVVDVWQTPLTKDPFRIPLGEKADLLLAITTGAIKQPGIQFCSAWYQALGEWKLFASSDGSMIEQKLTRIGPGYEVTAVGGDGSFVTRSHEIAPMQAGWEYVEASPLLADVPRMAADAMAKLNAPPVVPGKKDLVLAPSHLWLTIHESIGHPTELDRALGYEANFAGTSFATPDKLGKLQYGANIVNVYGDKTTPGGLATCGYDDDGVATQKWDILKNGLFVGYQTTREQAGWIGEKASRGTAYAQDYKSVPFQRMPNMSLAPGDKDHGLDELVAATDDGILITGDGSWSIDHQRYNFQFGGQMFYAIKGGKIAGPLRDVAYHSNSVEFWNACDMVGGPSHWELGGSMYDGKGEPTQSNPVSHGCPPARFRGIDVLFTGKS